MEELRHKASDHDNRRVVRQMREMSVADKAWVAGIIEGEGCLRFYDATAGKASTCVASIVVVMTDQDAIEQLSATTGLGNSGENQRYGDDLFRRKRMFRWAVTDRQGVLDLLTVLRPYFRLRRRIEKLDELVAGIQADIAWMTSRERVFVQCGHDRLGSDNVGYRYDRRRNLDVPYCKICQKVGRPPSKTGKTRRRYPWDEWTNGHVWELHEKRDFDGGIDSFRTIVWEYAKTHNLKGLFRRGDGFVRLKFIPVGEYVRGMESQLSDERLCVREGCDSPVLRKSSLAKYCSDLCRSEWNAEVSRRSYHAQAR